jgi:hypothetical protein
MNPYSPLEAVLIALEFFNLSSGQGICNADQQMHKDASKNVETILSLSIAWS